MFSLTKRQAAILLGVVLLVAVAGYFAYQHFNQPEPVPVPAPAVKTITLPPQVIHTNTETIREVVVQAPSQPGAVLQFVEREGKIVAIVNGEEVEVPNQTGQPEIKLGENGELRMSSVTTTRIDVTDMANAQARLIANQELEKQAVVHKKEMDKEKSARKKERLFWIVGAGVGGYLLAR
ncbi:hypothetical protein [Sporomusa sphaeroides]|uniref:hypothetical protein n=1 Tax=Sporomusa sphaeroides TaxID=47679 RepID=UPI00202E2F79|nr:hypothetical protein [Sporomusa sphaeroides]MCM0759926.1 hypothetical protein [Sporomusa sphaeroides DSM 2875]HML33874.1 hypothetical protein [Sporomusa sphaeroides]